MTNANDVRRAHDILDDISIGNQPNEGNLNHLRSFLPDLPKQKTLEEITEHVYDAWVGTNGNEWPDDVHGGLETWLAELHTQLQGLKDTPVSSSSLPAGMRIAFHVVYGRVVVSPVVDDDGTCKIFHLSTHARDGSDYCWTPVDYLTFIDAEPAAPAKPAHPEFLETEADYAAAPDGTIVASAENLPCHKFQSNWSSVGFIEMKDDKGMSRFSRRVLRFGWGDE